LAARCPAGQHWGSPDLLRAAGICSVVARSREADDVLARPCARSPAPCSFITPTSETCRYLVALTRRHT
jgi:hypothetical protein